MSAPATVPLLYTVSEAARILRVSEKTLIAEIKAGRLRYVLVGKRCRIKPADIDWYVRERAGAVEYDEAFGPPVPKPFFGARDAGMICTRTRSGAKLRSKPCDLSVADVAAMMKRSAGLCEMTDIPFSREVIAGTMPWAPSVDRIDARQGYSASNCRLVCYAVNLALNAWGDEVLITIARALCGRVGRPASGD